MFLKTGFLQFYKKEVRLEEGIEVDGLLNGKGTTFSVQEEALDTDVVNDMRKFNDCWGSNEISTVGIDPSAHEGVSDFI